jgi:opacity protein-like surface antigen
MTRHLAWALLPLGLLASPAGGQSLADYDYDNLAFRGVGFDYGHIWPSRVNATSMYSFRLDLGFLGPAVRIMPSVSYWSSELKASELERLAERLTQLPVIRDDGLEITGGDLGVVKWSDLAFSLDAQLVWTAPFNVYTFVGAGFGVHALNGRGDAVADTFIEDLLDSTTAGLAFSAGLELQPVERLRLYVEARYTAASDVRYPGVRIGAALMLPAVSNAMTTGTGGR